MLCVPVIEESKFSIASMADEYSSDCLPEKENANVRPTSPYHQKCVQENLNSHFGFKETVTITRNNKCQVASCIYDERSRTISPAKKNNGKLKFNPKRFFPYCTNDLFDMPVERQMVVKFSRDELENKFLNLGEENIFLKKTLNEQNRVLKKLQVQVKRLESGQKRRGSTSPTNRLKEERIKKLEEVKKLLEEKVDVLKQQLQSHSRLHAQVHRSYPNTGFHRVCQSYSPGGVSSFMTGDNYSRNCGTPNSQSDYIKRPHTSYGEGRDNIRSSSRELTAGCGGQFLDIDLEDEHIAQHLDNIDPLSECPEQVDCEENMSKVAENIELIRLKRLLKRQAAQLAAMTAHAEAAEKEIQSLRNDCQTLSGDNENLKKLLSNERQKVHTMLREINSVTTLKQDIRMLEEQVRDLKQERYQLKDHNEKLLKLAAHKSDGDSDTTIKDCEKQLNESGSSSVDVSEIQKQIMLGLNVTSNEMSVSNSPEESRSLANNGPPGSGQTL